VLQRECEEAQGDVLNQQQRRDKAKKDRLCTLQQSLQHTATVTATHCTIYCNTLLQHEACQVVHTATVTATHCNMHFNTLQHSLQNTLQHALQHVAT